MTRRYIHIHTKEIRNEGITSLLQTLNLVIPLQNLCELDDNCPSGSGQWASSIWKWEGRQKNTTNASIKQGKNHNFLTTMKAKKIKNTAVLFKLGYLYSVFLCLLSSWRRFFHWIASPNWSFNSVIWQNPRMKFVFRMRSCPWDL